MIARRHNTRIDMEMVAQLEKERHYWMQVLRRSLLFRFWRNAVCLFRGDSQELVTSCNGNYLGYLELVAKFDPFLNEHLQKYGNPGKGNVSYLSATICDEFISVLAKAVHDKIVSEVKEAKYFGVSIDSTPDIAHIDQLTITLRYCLPNGKVVERFLDFISIQSHCGDYLFSELENLLKQNEIELTNCRSQSYDNASPGTFAREK